VNGGWARSSAGNWNCSEECCSSARNWNCSEECCSSARNWNEETVEVNTNKHVTLRDWDEPRVNVTRAATCSHGAVVWMDVIQIVLNFMSGFCRNVWICWLGGGGGGSAHSKGFPATSEHAQKHCAAILLFEPRRSAVGSLECHEQLVGLVFGGMEMWRRVAGCLTFRWIAYVWSWRRHVTLKLQRPHAQLAHGGPAIDSTAVVAVAWRGDWILNTRCAIKICMRLYIPYARVPSTLLHCLIYTDDVIGHQTMKSNLSPVDSCKKASAASARRGV
jgi:hypothetical protein